MAEWVLAVERAYVAAATSKRHVTAHDDGDRARALAAMGAVASHYLAVGTPRTMGLVIDDATRDAGALSIEAHRTWFKPSDIRCALVHGASTLIDGTRPTTLAEALACDIVCIHTAIELDARALRRGTHVNVLAQLALSDELAQIAVVSRELPDLGAMAAGFVDGRQLDEITIFVAGDAAIALEALR